jgi:molybdate transport system substrate-binding protein
MNVLSAGAAKGLLQSVAADEGIELVGEFGAVGAIRARLDAGAACDVIVLTDTMMAELSASGIVLPDSVTSLGKVYTGVAVPSAAPRLPVDTVDALKDLLHNASRIYFPDATRSTAGIHFMKVLTALGLDQSHRERFATYPNGAVAMRAMADSGDPRAVGVTQCSEILYTPGVAWLGPLPSEFALATGYTAAMVQRAADPLTAMRLLRALAADSNRATRLAAGFESR